MTTLRNHNNKITFPVTLAIALGATLLCTPVAMAAENNLQLNTADTRFIQDEAAAGVAVVKMAELGGQNAQHDKVKAFAALLAADHATANAELAGLAAGKGVELSTEPFARYEDMQDELERASGADFDQKFLLLIGSGHERSVKSFKVASVDAVDSDVKAWATRMLPAMQLHLEEARKLSAELSATDKATPINPPVTQADNTARNVVDRDMTSLTPLDQGNSQADIDTTARIRRAIIESQGLSVNAQNIKIITSVGRVTLRGPVDSADEKLLIGEIATRIATPEQTDNQLEVRAVSVN